MKKAFGIVFLAVFTMFFTVGLETADAAQGGGPEAKLKGTYFRTRTRTCIRTDGDFIANPTSTSNGNIINATFANTRTNVTSGNITFNGDGTGTLDFIGMSIRLVGGVTEGGGRRQIRFTGPGTCDFTYTVDPDNSFVVTTTGCSTANTTATGPVLQGRMANGGQSLILFDHDSNVETLVSITSGNITRRICNRSGSAVKVNN